MKNGPFVELAFTQRLMLKPCPFCGQWNDLRMMTPEVLDLLAPDLPFYIVVCDGCGAMGPVQRSFAWALEEWNERSGEAKTDGP